VPSVRAPERARRALPAGLVVRSAAEADVAGIEQLVSDVVSEAYGDLFPGGAPPPSGHWECGLVAELGGRIVGVVVADDDWVEDLWVARGHRERGIGSVLLAAAERQIAERGHGEARLRVVAANARARGFYGARGWADSVAHPHETFGFAMLEMRKTLAP
jgi:GNAT superfamily N-acetyltransferase